MTNDDVIEDGDFLLHMKFCRTTLVIDPLTRNVDVLKEGMHISSDLIVCNFFLFFCLLFCQNTLKMFHIIKEHVHSNIICFDSFSQEFINISSIILFYVIGYLMKLWFQLILCFHTFRYSHVLVY